MTELLDIRNLTVRFGGVTAINNLTLTVNEGELRCVIGPNGAGKSTLFNLITGYIKPTSGDIFFQGHRLTQLAPHRISRLGIGRKFQVPSIFPDLTVAENLRVAFHGKDSFAGLAWETNGRHESEVESLLRQIHLVDKQDWRARTLSHGEKQWLEIGMVLANRPRLLLLDEPVAGMSVEERRETAELIRRIAVGLTLIVIEHDIHFVRQIAERITVLHQGSKLAEGTFAEIEGNEMVRKVYLGRQEDE